MSINGIPPSQFILIHYKNFNSKGYGNHIALVGDLERYDHHSRTWTSSSIWTWYEWSDITRLITALRTAVEKGDGTPDKKATSHDGLLDASVYLFSFGTEVRDWMMDLPTPQPKSSMTAPAYYIMSLYSNLTRFTHRPILIIWMSRSYPVI